MGERTQSLATQLERVSEDLVAFIRQCPNEDWRAVTKAEQWPVCVVCRHIARALEVQPQVFRLAAQGGPLPSDYTWEDIHRSNAEQAQEWAHIAKEDVLLPLRRDANTAIAFVRLLSDAQLDHTTQSPLDDTTMRVQQMIEGMIDHAHTHLESARATLQKR